MFLSLALTLLCQEPALRWSRDVDELFWQALHLLEVEERADDAVVTLAGLIDEPSVQQYRGQTGYVLAQQYRALRAGGRHEEAAALLPTIRRDVANTPMAQASEAVIELADRVHAPQDSVDQELVEMLVEATLRNQYLHSLVTGYGEQVVPELLEIFDNVDLYFDRSPGGNRASRVQILWQTAFMLNSSKLLEAMAQRVERRGADQMGRFPVGSLSMGPEIGDAQLAFLVRLSRHEEVAVASEAIERMSMFASTEPSAHDRCLEILRDEPRLAPLVLQRIYWQSTDESLRALFMTALDSEHEVVARTARSLAMDTREEYSLHHLTVTYKDADARAELLAGFAPRTRHDRPNASTIGSSLIPEYEVASRSIELPGIGEEGAAVDWLAWIQGELPMLESVQREMVFVGALQRGLYDLAVHYLETFDAPEDLAWYLRHHDLQSEPRLRPFLEAAAMVDEDVQRHFHLLASIDAHLTPIHVVERLTELRDPSWGNGDFLGRLPERGESQGAWRDRCLAIAALDVNSIDRRLQLLSQYFASLQREGCDLQGIQRGLDVFPEESDWVSSNWARQTLDPIRGCVRFVLADGQWGVDMEQVLAKVLGLLMDFEESYAKLEARESLNADRIFYLADADLNSDPLCKAIARAVVQRPVWVKGAMEGRYSAFNQMGAYLQREVSFLQAAFELKAEIDQWRVDTRQGQFSEESLRFGLQNGPEPFVVAVWLQSHVRNEGLLPEVAKVLSEFAERDIQKPEIAVTALTFMLGQGMDEQEWIGRARQVAAMDLSWGSRKALVQLIGNRYTPELVSVLLDAQTDASGSVAGAADTALERYARIRDARQSWQAWERQGRDGSPIDALLEKTGAERPTRVRLAAIQSLEAMQAKEALPFLVELLEDADAQVVDAAQAAIDAIIASSRGDDEE